MDQNETNFIRSIEIIAIAIETRNTLPKSYKS